MSFITPGETLKKIRVQLDITQNDLVNAGISRNFISMFESGKRKLSKETASRIINILKNIAIQKGIDIDKDIEYLYISPEDAAKVYCNDNLGNISNEIDIDEVINICKEYKFDSMLRQATIVKANILYDETKYKQALYYYQEALESSIKYNKNYELISMLYNKLGKCKLELLGYDEALIFFQKSYQYAIICDDELHKRNALFNIALVNKKLGFIDEALINIDKFINIINNEQNTDDYINAVILKSNCYISKNEYTKALNLYKDMEAIIIDESNLLGYIYNNIGVVYFNLDELNDALFYFEKAGELRKKYDKANLAYTLIDESQIYIKKDLFKKAIQLLEEGMHIASNFNDIFCIIKAYTLLEEIYLNINDLEKVEKLYVSMLEVLQCAEDKDQVNMILNKLSLININKGNIEKGKMYLEIAIGIRKSNII